MASGRINRNVPSARLGGLGGNTREVCYYRRSETPDRSSVTELPGLTSDPIYTADRRGGILISFGRNRSLGEGINPSRCPAHRPTGRPRVVPEATTFAFNPKCPVSLKGIGSLVAETALRRRVPAPSVPSAWYLMAGRAIGATGPFPVGASQPNRWERQG